MNILFVLDHLTTTHDFNGLSRWFLNTLKPMHKLNNNIDVVGQYSGDSDELTWIRNYCENLYSFKPKNHYRYSYKYFMGWDYHKIFAYNSDVAKFLQKKCEENNYDIAIMVGHGTHVYIPYLAAKYVMAAPLDAPEFDPSNASNKITSQN